MCLIKQNSRFILTVFPSYCIGGIFCGEKFLRISCFRKNYTQNKILYGSHLIFDRFAKIYPREIYHLYGNSLPIIVSYYCMYIYNATCNLVKCIVKYCVIMVAVFVHMFDMCYVVMYMCYVMSMSCS